MKDERLRAAGLVCLTPTLPLIPVTQLHNSYAVTDHPQPASLEPQLMKQGGGNCLSNADTDETSLIYLIANMTELLQGLVCCTITGHAADSSVVQRHA